MYAPISDERDAKVARDKLSLSTAYLEGLASLLTLPALKESHREARRKVQLR